MRTDEIVARPRSSLGRTLKTVLAGIVGVLALLFVVHAVWRASGSNRWELIAEKNGAQVFGLKQPGTDLKLFRGVTRVRSSLAAIVAWLQDPETCRDAGCEDAQTLERVNDELQYVSFRFRMPPPFAPREFILRQRFHQIPGTNEIWAEYTAAPEKSPPGKYFRVTIMSNTWRATPLVNGEVEVEYTMNMDWGGFFPDVMSNIIRPQFMMNQLQSLQGYFNREKYKTVRYDFVHEPGGAQPGASIESRPASH